MNFGGQSSGSSTNQTMMPTLPASLKGILGGKNSAGGPNIPDEIRQFLATNPSISQYINSMPVQGVAPLSSDQNADIGSIQAQATNPYALNPNEQSADATYRSLSQGVNPAIAYGENVFKQSIAPTVENAAGLAGMGHSGALGENLGNAEANFLLPMAQEGYGMQATGAAGEAALGNTSYSQGTENLQNALTAAGIPTQIAQEILTNQYQSQLMKTQAGLGLETGIADWLPSLIGNKSSGHSSGAGLNWSVG